MKTGPLRIVEEEMGREAAFAVQNSSREARAIRMALSRVGNRISSRIKELEDQPKEERETLKIWCELCNDHHTREEFYRSHPNG